MKFETRREFLLNTGKVLGSAALMAAPLTKVVAEDTPAAPAHPFPYVKLDPEETLARAYESFGKFGGCCGGAFEAIVGQLAEKVGYPWNQIPPGMMSHGAAGYGAYSLCGSLGGCAAALGLVCERADASAIFGQLKEWYKVTAFPNYDPEGYKPTNTVANSVNCMDSVGNFMSTNGITEMSAPNRIARCKGVTAECAAKTVELLNAHFGV